MAKRRWVVAGVIAAGVLVPGGLVLAHVHPHGPVAGGTTPTPGFKVSTRHGLRYRTADGVPLSLDLYRPVDPGARVPAVVMVHGGAWFGGDERFIAPEAAALARAGFAAFAVDYRLAPYHPFPSGLDDVRAAIAWVRVHAHRFRVDPSRIGVWGTSAGGNLATMVATTGPSSVRAVVSWSGIYDIGALVARRYRNYAFWALQYLGCNAPPCPGLVEASPIDRVTATDPPMLLASSRNEGQGCSGPQAVGWCEEPRHHGVGADQARAMAARLRAAGVPCTLLILPGSEHGKAYAEQAMGPTIEFLRRFLGSPSAA